MSDTRTRTSTATTTITGGDVRKVWRCAQREIRTICSAAAGLAPDFDVDSALEDCAFFALADVISAVRLQIYLAGELVREYAYVVSDEPLAPAGTSADRPPLGEVPEGARVRLVATRNPAVTREEQDLAFNKRGWITASPLRIPESVAARQYGTFASGGYAVRRELLSNPKYDLPVGKAGQHMAKGR